MSSTSCVGVRCTTRNCRGCYGEIAEIVASTRGLYTLQTKGHGDAHTLNVMWRVMGEVAEDLLTRTRSCIVTDFFHASIKTQKVSSFNGDRVLHKPQFVLLPDFTSKFHLKNVLVMRDAHYHATTPSTVSNATIAASMGIDRYVVEAGIKDSVREIGKYLERNREAVITIDVGFGFLEFRGREYRVKWDPLFLERLQIEIGSAGVVIPYDPPSLTTGGPTADCRFSKGCLTHPGLQQSLEQTLEAESRISVAEMNDGYGGSGYYKTHW